jgi:UDP-glucuronate decarboxylase
MRKPDRHPVVEEDLQYITSLELPWAEFIGKTVLISGANGFLPAYMVETLLYLNELYGAPLIQVIGLVRSRERAQARFRAYHGRSDLRLLVQDVCEPVVLNEPIHVVIHAASQASPKYYGLDPVGTLLPNTLGTYNLLRLAYEKSAIRFLFFSSSEVYGCIDSTHGPVAEDAYGYLDPLELRSCYGESKRLGETMCISWHSQYGVPAVIVRPFHTYGPGMRLDDGRVFADFVSDILHGRDIQMRSNGQAMRAFCYLADAVAGFFTVLLKGTPGQAYNIGNDKGELTVAELAELLVDLAPIRGLKIVSQAHTAGSGYAASTVARICPDITRARSLGWQPVTSPREGFARTLRSFV